MNEQSHVQTPTSTSTTTGVFALLKAKPGVTRERVMAIMPAEIRADRPTLSGRQDTRVVHARRRERGWPPSEHKDVSEARSIMESLPLAKENLLDHEYIPVGPLMPLRLLLGNQSTRP